MVIVVRGLEALERFDHVVELVELAAELRQHVGLPQRGLEHPVFELARIELPIRGFEDVVKMMNEDVASHEQAMPIEITLGHE